MLENVEKIFLSILKDNAQNEEINRQISSLDDKDWQKLYKLAKQNDLIPLFYSRLVSLAPKNFPEELRSRLKNFYYLNLKRNFILERRILEIIQYLKKNKTPAIPLKGPIFARLLYDNLGLRQAPCDLDLLVPATQLVEIEKKLQELGYAFYNSYLKPDFFHRYKKQVNLLRMKEKLNGITLDLDLHWDFRTGYINTDIDDFWNNAKEINLNGYQILMFSAEDLLLFLALASVTDYEFVQLKYIYEVHRLILKFEREINWQKLIRKAKKLYLNTAFFFSLKLSQDLFDTRLPDKFLHALKPAFFKRTFLKFWINEAKVIRYREKVASSYLWWVFLGNYIYAENIFSCLRIVLKRIFLPTEQVKCLYNQIDPSRNNYAYFKRLFRNLGNFLGFEKVQ